MTVPIARRRALLLCALATPLSACERAGARAAPALLSPQQLHEDLAQWRQAVLLRHPRFHGQERLDDALESAFARTALALTAPLSHQQAFAQLARINPFLLDAHTLLMPWLDGRSPEPALRDRQFRFGVRLDPDGALRLRSGWRRARDGLELAAGTRVLDINGQPIDAVLQALEACSHGETAALRRHMLALMWPQWLHAVLGWQGDFNLRVQAAADAPAELALQAGEAWVPTRPPVALPVLQPLSPGAAWLRVPTFDVDEDPAAFKRAVAAAFAQLRRQRIEYLVIDVRGNTGGQSEAGAEIIRPLIDRPVQQVARARERLNADNNGWLGYRGPPGSMRELDLASDGVIEPLPAAERWRGRAVVLVDEMTYSAAILFATTLQDQRLARLVGRATGGHGNQTGNMMPTRLRHSGFTAFIATRDFIRPSGDTRAQPVRPDIEVGAAATATGDQDPVVQRALEALREGR
ncbi:MAG TPA: S41 family peptidase [Ideonella sp.]|nr:S41 family peptidase [Ideonella sp.]